jgi:hypothetical protein
MPLKAILARLKSVIRSEHWSDSWIAFGGGTVFSLLFSYPILLHMTYPGGDNDWDFSLEMEWVPYHILRHFHQIPLWDPWKCGGLPMLANPQSRLMTPMFLLTLLFGPVLGLHLEIILHLLLAWAGGYLLGRELKLSRMASFGAATLFPASSWFYLRAAEGHAVMFPLAYLPWIALFALWAIDRRMTWAIAAAFVMAVMLGEGGVYGVTFAAVFLAVLLVAMTPLIPSIRPLLALAVTGVFTLGFSAVKLLPSITFMGEHPRPAGEGYATDPWVMFTALFSPDQDKYRASPASFGFHEYGAFVGVAFFLLAVMAFLAPWRKALPWFAACLVVYVFSRGENPLLGVSLWTLLHPYPIFSAQRLPSRWHIPLVFTLSVLVGFGIDGLRNSLGRSGTARAAILLAIGILECFFHGPPNLRYIMQAPEDPPPDVVEGFHQDWGMVNSRMYMIAQRNVGSLNCYEYTDFPIHAKGINQPGYRGEAYFLTGAQSVKLINWTPEALTYDIQSATPDLLIINQNYNPAWKIVEGSGKVTPYDGLLSIQVAAGSQRLRLAYRSSGFYLGAVIGIITALLAASWIALDLRLRPSRPIRSGS